MSSIPDFRVPELAEIDREIVKRGGLYQFVRRAWAQVEPKEFVPGWHLEELCVHLEAVTRGEITRLVVNVPPGTSKSLVACVFWPAWVWSFEPAHKWIFASYSAALSRRDAVRMRNLIDDPWYSQRWPGVRIPFQNTRSATDFATDHGGFRFSTSLEGSATGRHADTQVVDDPLKPLDVAVPGGLALSKALSWWAETMASRAADPKTLRRVIIMQRLHERDLSGEVLREGGYVHLRLPMRFEAASACKTLAGGDRRTVDGELLCPARFGEEDVKRLETEMGARVAAAQLQQRPSPAGGGIFKREWFRYWGRAGSTFPELPWKGSKLIQSWDCTFKDAATSDFVCGQAWLQNGADCFLVDRIKERLSFSATIDAILAWLTKWPQTRAIYVEDKANGPAVQDVLARRVQRIVLVNPEGGKEARANAIEPLYEAGNVWHPAPEIAPWIGDHEEELLSFPAGRHDDSVDAETQALLKLGVNRGLAYKDAMANVRKWGSL